MSEQAEPGLPRTLLAALEGRSESPLHASTRCNHLPSKGGRAKPEALLLGADGPLDSRIRDCDGEDVIPFEDLPAPDVKRGAISTLEGCNGESMLETLLADCPTDGLEAGTTAACWSGVCATEPSVNE